MPSGWGWQTENAYPSLRNYWIALKGLWIKPGNELRKRSECRGDRKVRENQNRPVALKSRKERMLRREWSTG